MRKDILLALGQKPTLNTIDKLAAATGHAKRDIAIELNRMRADDLVDRDKGKFDAEFSWRLLDGGKRELALLQNEPHAQTTAAEALPASDEAKALRDQLAQLKEVAARNNAALLDKVADLEADLVLSKQQIANLENEIGHLTIERDALREQLDTAPDAGADGYLVVAPKRALRKYGKADSAKAAAMAAARNGSGRGDVYALTKIGRAVRGAEWKEGKAA